MNRCPAFVLFPITLILVSCGGESQLTLELVKSTLHQTVTPDYYLTGTKTQQAMLSDLFSLLDRETKPGPVQFSIVREIAVAYIRQEEYATLINFLNARVAKEPDDPYNAFYLHMIAYSWSLLDAVPVAARYFDLVLKNYPDLTVAGKSIHMECLSKLITLIHDPEQQVLYYQELISRFPDKIDMGRAYFMLAQAYEQTGEWHSAIEAYSKYLPYAGTIIPGFPNADHYAKQLVDFNNSPKDWAFENVNTLVAAIKAALDSGNANRLWQYRAKVNFFARSWAQEDTDDSGMADFNMTEFMHGSRISYTNSLDASSNASEAYLRTWGWAQYSTWYLYFRKIYFPADPEIHGWWEWAGVYYGEKF
jgi:hypothetical protein